MTADFDRLWAQAERQRDNWPGWPVRCDPATILALRDRIAQLETVTADARQWTAGQFTDCNGGTTHTVSGIHVIVRCACGASFMSTDSSIAIGMAFEHAAKEAQP